MNKAPASQNAFNCKVKWNNITVAQKHSTQNLIDNEVFRKQPSFFAYLPGISCEVNVFWESILDYAEKAGKTDDAEPEVDRPRTRKRAAQEAQQKAAVETPPIKTRRRQAQLQSQAQQSSSESDSASTNGPTVKQNSTTTTDSGVSTANDIDRPDAGMSLKVS